MNFIYLYLNIFTLAFPLARSFENKIQYSRKWKALFPAIILVGVFFILWDIEFTRNGIWGFNERYLAGIYYYNLPLEEWLFFMTVPFASVFIYECVLYFLPNLKNPEWIKFGTLFLSLFLITLALIYRQMTYTFWDFLFAGLFLLFVFFKNPKWLVSFYITYFLHLIPFFLVNGILTGAFIEDEVVWYNNDENLGIRLLTIPVEDTIYALLLLLMNIYFFEMFKKSESQPT